MRKRLKKDDAYLKIEPGFVDAVLDLAGYTEWVTIHNGEKKEGYIRELSFQKRFHLFYTEGAIKLHLDKVIENEHRSVNWQQMLAIEIKRIRKIYKGLLPLVPPKTAKEKKDWGRATAENVMELQKRHKTTIIRKTRWQKIIDFLLTNPRVNL
jgi:hypothetical protein